jgi:kynureninase
LRVIYAICASLLKSADSPHDLETRKTAMTTQTRPITRADAAKLDADDPLAPCRDRFQLPPGVIYLDGNSLGALPRSVPPRLQRAVEQEWGVGLIRSWNDADWYPAPQRVGGRIARLVGAAADEVVCADSTSVNLFKVLVAALRLRPGRKRIVGELGNFPTDGYVASGVAALMDAEFVALDSEAVPAAIDETVAIVSLTHVNYKTGRVHDMAGITRRAHAAGALVVWDLCHTAGAMPCDLIGCDADFAVGCGYKYLNGGPGAPAFVFVAKRHHAGLNQPLTGWHGHARPFAFVDGYEAAPGIDRMLVGTASQLGLISLEAALEAFDGVDMAALRRKSVALTELFIRLVDQELAGFGLASPRDAALRGSQVSLTHEQGYAIMQALIARGVIGDYRAPDILRFGFAALYVGFIDVWNAVAALQDVMATKAWTAPEFVQRKAVT